MGRSRLSTEYTSIDNPCTCVVFTTLTSNNHTPSLSTHCAFDSPADGDQPKPSSSMPTDADSCASWIKDTSSLGGDVEMMVVRVDYLGHPSACTFSTLSLP